MGSVYKNYGDDIAPPPLSPNCHPWDGKSEASVALQDPQQRESIIHSEVRNRELESQVDTLRKENNLLKLKVEILLDMLAQRTAEAEMNGRDIDKMRSVLTGSSGLS